MDAVRPPASLVRVYPLTVGKSPGPSASPGSVPLRAAEEAAVQANDG